MKDSSLSKEGIKMFENTCCFFGHRKTEDSKELRARLYKTLEKLITEENIDTFLFGSRSDFNRLCYDTVTVLKQKYPHIRRIYVRAEYRFIDDEYKKYLLSFYEDTYYSDRAVLAGKYVYIERNREMIDKSRICVVYYSPDYLPPHGKSGTAIAFAYASKKGRKLLNFYAAQ